MSCLWLFMHSLLLVPPQFFIDLGMPKKALFKILGSLELDAIIGCRAAITLAKLFGYWLGHLQTFVELKNLAAMLSLARVPNKELSLPKTLNPCAALVFTSGGTGVPKGVTYSEASFLAQQQAIAQAFELQAGQIEISGFALFSLHTILLGVQAVLLPLNYRTPQQSSPQILAAGIIKHRAQLVSGSPVFWQNLYSYAKQHQLNFPTVRTVVTFGAPIRETWLQQWQEIFPNAQCLTPYGATECLPITKISSQQLLQEFLGTTALGHGTCVGQPLPGVKVKIVASVPASQTISELRALPDGQIGEIVVHAPWMSQAYLNSSYTKASKFTDSSGCLWHRMGDEGYFDRAGNLWFCGRSAHVVQGLYPIMCEGPFLTSPYVARAALVQLQTQGQSTVAMALQLSQEGLANQTYVKTKLQALLESDSVNPGIKRLIYVTKMPLDVRHNLKIDRIKLAQQLS